MSLDQLSSTLKDILVLPGSTAFDEARLHHGQPGEPAAVARVTDVDDVVAALTAASEAGLPVAVRGGGHGMWETLPGALVVDLRALHDIEI